MSGLRFLLTLLAVLALTGPSLAVGFAALSAGGAAVAVAAAESDAPVPAYRPCDKQGGKRVLPCPPDLGVPPLTATGLAWSTAPLPVPAAAPMPPERAPKTDPPPPRRR